MKEKTAQSKRNLVFTFFYFFDNRVVDVAKNVRFSGRGELEITSLNQDYLTLDALSVMMLGCGGYTRLDTGTHDAMLEAAQYMDIIKRRQGYKIACLEEIAWSSGWIKADQMLKKADELCKNGYENYLRKLVEMHVNNQ
ncbi:MAG: sugar phosphate nucleotidyltransferase [Balneolaceae bacterium]